MHQHLILLIELKCLQQTKKTRVGFDDDKKKK